MRRIMVGLLGVLAAAPGIVALATDYDPPADRRYTRDDGQAMFAPAVECDFTGWGNVTVEDEFPTRLSTSLNCEDQNGHEWTEFWFSYAETMGGYDHGRCGVREQGSHPAENGREYTLKFGCADGTEFELVLDEATLTNIVWNLPDDPTGGDS